MSIDPTSLISEFADWLTQQVTIKRNTGRDQYGGRVLASPQALSGIRVSAVNRVVRNIHGEEKPVSIQIHVPGDPGITVDDLIALEGETTFRQIVQVHKYVNDLGAVDYTSVLL